MQHSGSMKGHLTRWPLTGRRKKVYYVKAWERGHCHFQDHDIFWGSPTFHTRKITPDNFTPVISNQTTSHPHNITPIQLHTRQDHTHNFTPAQNHSHTSSHPTRSHPKHHSNIGCGLYPFQNHCSSVKKIQWKLLKNCYFCDFWRP